jgi:hypothetical protein
MLMLCKVLMCGEPSSSPTQQTTDTYQPTQCWIFKIEGHKRLNRTDDDLLELQFQAAPSVTLPVVSQLTAQHHHE